MKPAGEKLRVEVMAEDIWNGVRGQARDCPIALALRRATGDPQAFAWFRNAYAEGKTWRMPPEAQAFVEAFDQLQPVSPLAFELEVM